MKRRVDQSARVFIGLVLVAAVAAPVGAAEFHRLPLVDPVTTMATSEDGSRLIVGHQEYDKISVIDTVTAKVVQTVPCPAPRHILCRGEKAIVANYGKGTISVYSMATWRPTDKVLLSEANVDYLSAPGGRNFSGHLLATCRVDRNSQAFFHVDLRRERARKVDQRLYISAVTVDYDGRAFFWQGEIGHSPSAPISEPLSFRDLMANRPARALGQGTGGEPAPIVYQVRSGPFWFGDKYLLRGLPPRVFNSWGKLLVPDRRLEVFYVFDKGLVTCMALDGELTDLGVRQISYPADFKRMSPDRLPMAWEHRGDVHYEHAAITIGDTLHVYVLDQEAQSIFYCEMPAFEVPSRLVSRPQQGDLAGDAPGSQFLPAEPDAAMDPDVPGRAAGAGPPAPSLPSGGRPAGAGDDFEVDGRRLRLPFGPYQLAPGGDGGTLLLLCGERLAILGPDGWTIQSKRTFEKPYVQIAERPDYYVAISSAPYGIDLIDKKKSKPRKSFAFNCMEPTDLALNPTAPLSYVAMKTGIEVPRYHFFVYNERSGEGRESEDFVGTWLAVDPRGRWLIAGYRDIYERGSRLIINPDRLHLVPQYGSIDWLIRYRLDRNGLPQMSDVKEKAGGNGSGIRLAPDGSRVTYLSYVGSPMFSKNLCGWDPEDLGKMPVSFPVKDVGGTQELAYHPFLPLVASPGADSVAVIDFKSGQVETDRVGLDADVLSGGKLERLWFSPDGKSVVLAVTADGATSLVRADLRLSDEERRVVEREFKSRGSRRPAPVRPRPSKPIPVAELDALQAAAADPMNAKEIARRFSAAVVVIASGDATATGFVIGSGGYVLTCAHALDEPGEVTVAWRLDENGKTTSAEAEVIRVDERRDLALLKIKPAGPLPTVRIAPAQRVETGEAVTVIGNPGVGSMVLDHTLTTGVVSNPRREIDGLAYLQTSAAVNPGSSGGPMFDSRGLVVGLVVLKAQIEAAGFAVPADTIRDFLGASGGPVSLVRTWTDSTGRFKLEAELVNCDADNVELRKSDGSTVAVPRSRLSRVDQQWLASPAGQAAIAKVKAER